MSDTNPNEVLDAAIAEYIAAGWDLHQATPTGVQLKHPAGRSIYLTAAMAARGELPELADSPWLAAAARAKAGLEREVVIEIPLGEGEPEAPTLSDEAQQWRGALIIGAVLLGLFLCAMLPTLVQVVAWQLR